MKWTIVSPKLAKAHPLYGIKNWLLVFSLGLLIGPIKDVGMLVGEAARSGITLTALLAIEDPNISFVKFALLLQSAIILTVYVLLFSKSRQFRPTSSLILLSSWPLLACVAQINRTPEVTNTLALNFISWATSCAIWVTYLNCSRRVRVTFEEKVDERYSSKILISDDGAHGNLVVTDHARTNALPGTLFKNNMGGAVGEEDLEKIKANYLEQLCEEGFWELALIEVDGGSRRAGLWARCFASVNGNELEAKAMYLRERAGQMKAEHQAGDIARRAPPSY